MSHLIKSVLCLSIWCALVIIIGPILLPIVTLLCVYRTVLHKSISLGRYFANFTELLPVMGLDVGFANDDFWNQPKGAIGVVNIFNGPMNPVEIESKLKQLLSQGSGRFNYERLISLTITNVLGYPFWKPVETFDLQNHIHVHDVPDKLTKLELNSIVSNWNQSPFKVGCPLWNVLIIPSYSTSTEDSSVVQSILALRVHHMIGDGYSIRQFLENLFSEEPLIAESIEPISQSNPVKSESCFPQFMASFWAPLTFASFIYDFFIHRDSVTTNPKRSQAGHVFASTLCSLKEWKLLRQTAQKYLQQSARNQDITVVQLTFGALFMHLFVSALRKFLLDQKKLTENGLPHHINIAASIPIGSSPHPTGTFCNHWTHAIFSVPCLEPNPTARLRNLTQNYQSVLRSGAPNMHTSLAKYHHIIPNCIWKCISSLNIGTSIGFVNLPGPQNDAHLTFCGASLQEIIPIAGPQWKHTCMTVAVFSYNDKIAVSILANQDFISSVPQAELFLNKYFQEEIRELKNYVLRMVNGNCPEILILK